MVEWENGDFLGQEDSACLQEAATQGLTLVTYDRRTIPPLLKAWAEEERGHGGGIFFGEKKMPPSDTGALISALRKLARKTQQPGRTTRGCFLQRRWGAWRPQLTVNTRQPSF